MEQQLKQAWIHALRSETYQQCRGVLRRITSDGACAWCCLGVLLDVSRYGEWAPAQAQDEGGVYRTPDGQRHDIIPEERLMLRLGLFPQTMDRLTRMNDREYKSFADIATWIEEHV